MRQRAYAARSSAARIVGVLPSCVANENLVKE